MEPVVARVLGSGSIVVIPAIGGLIFGPLIYFFAREAKGHGVPEVMFAVAQQGGRIRPRVAVIKSLASAICIGSGGSVGREGPIVQVGSALGSTLGQITGSSADRTRTLVACGAAGGIAATFNAPIAGVFFALEVILGEFTTRAFGTVVLSSVAASVVGRAVFGNSPAFPVPEYELVSAAELALYAILAAMAAIVGVGFTKILYWFEDRFDDLPIVEYIKPLPGGLMLGGLAFFVPEILGVGYGPMESALTGDYGLQFLVLLLGLKLIAVSITIGSGGSGGVFAPSLFLGAMVGTGFGTAAGEIFPGHIAPPGAYGLVGMAAVFAGAARAPITAVIILFELSGDYRIILPLMGAVVISTFVSEALSRDTIYTLKLRRRGIDLNLGRDVDIMRSIQVRDAMSTDVPKVRFDVTVAEAAELVEELDSRVLVVVDDSDRMYGIVTLSDFEEALLSNRPGASLAEIASHPVVIDFPDAPLSGAIHRMSSHEIGHLPIVSREDPRRVVGLLRRANIVYAYTSAMLDRLENQQGGPVSPSMLRGTQLVELTVQPGDHIAGRLLRELDLPGGALIIAVQRGDQVLIPHGDTELRARDRLQILVRDEGISELHDYLESLRQGPTPTG